MIFIDISFHNSLPREFTPSQKSIRDHRARVFLRAKASNSYRTVELLA